MNLLIRLIVSAMVVLLGAYIIPGVTVDGFGSALIVALVLGLLNAFVRPIIELLSLPLTILTLGLFHFVITVLMIYLTDYLVGGFEVAGFWPALLFGIFVALIGGLTSRSLTAKEV